MPRFSLTLVVLLNIVLWSGGFLPVCRAEEPAKNPAANAPIHIEADRMESDQRKESVTFAGNVEATQEDLKIQADQMEVRYRKSSPGSGIGVGGGQSIESLQATGNIKITKQDWRATGEKMEYQTEGRKVILTGESKVWQGNNLITGDRVILYLDEKKSVVEDEKKGVGSRVIAVFNPEPSETQQEEQPEK